MVKNNKKAVVKKSKVAQKTRSMNESDSSYFLKLVLYIMLGSFWIQLANPVHIGSIIINGIPFGLFVGLLFASHDHFQIDRKIEYALLLMMTIITFFLPAGIVL